MDESLQKQQHDVTEEVQALLDTTLKQAVEQQGMYNSYIHDIAWLIFDTLWSILIFYCWVVDTRSNIICNQCWLACKSLLHFYHLESTNDQMKKFVKIGWPRDWVHKLKIGSAVAISDFSAVEAICQLVNQHV